MPLIDYKLKESDFQERKISDLSDTPSSDGMTAADLKAYFDYVPKTLLAMGVINSIIDLLTSKEGAENIGVEIEKLESSNVKAALNALVDRLENVYTREEVDGIIVTEKENLVSDFSINEETGVITVTYGNGTEKTYDLGIDDVFKAVEEVMTLAEDLKEIAGGDIATKQFVENYVDSVMKVDESTEV